MLTIFGYQFQGPLTSLYEVPAVYLVVHKVNRTVLDVGETDKLNTRIANHERKSCWEANSQTSGYEIYAVVIQNQQERLNLEAKIRGFYTPTCGEK